MDDVKSLQRPGAALASFPFVCFPAPFRCHFHMFLVSSLHLSSMPMLHAKGALIIRFTLANPLGRSTHAPILQQRIWMHKSRFIQSSTLHLPLSLNERLPFKNRSSLVRPSWTYCSDPGMAARLGSQLSVRSWDLALDSQMSHCDRRICYPKWRDRSHFATCV